MRRVRAALAFVAFAIGPAIATSPARAQQTPPRSAGRVITDTLWSPSLGTKKAVVIYLPPSYATATARHFPVAYYLHGALGAETDWTRLGALHRVADSLAGAGRAEMIVVMPDGDDSFYSTWSTLLTIDACRATAPKRERVENYCVPWSHYDDYIARDLVQFVDGKYRTQPEREHRGIAGLSMGGYGAIMLALQYPETFSAAASHSGVLSPLYNGAVPFAAPPAYAPDVAALEQARGWLWPYMAPVFGRDPAGWKSRDPARRLAQLVAQRGVVAVPALFADAGSADGFTDESRAFRWEAERLGVPLAYHEWPGGHEWIYWRAHVGESLAFLAEHIGR